MWLFGAGIVNQLVSCLHLSRPTLYSLSKAFSINDPKVFWYNTYVSSSCCVPTRKLLRVKAANLMLKNIPCDLTGNLPKSVFDLLTAESIAIDLSPPDSFGVLLLILACLGQFRVECPRMFPKPRTRRWQKGRAKRKKIVRSSAAALQNRKRARGVRSDDAPQACKRSLPTGAQERTYFLYFNRAFYR